MKRLVWWGMSQDKLIDIIDGGVMRNDTTLELDIGETRIVEREQADTQGGDCGCSGREYSG